MPDQSSSHPLGRCGARRAPSTRGATASLGVAAFGLLLSAGCGGSPSIAPKVAVADRAVGVGGSFADVLTDADTFNARTLRWPDAVVPETTFGRGYDCVVLYTAEPDAARRGWPEPTQQRVREFVEKGGRLVLMGFAARIAHELGFESVEPDKYEAFSWGDDARTAVGVSQWGLTTADDIERLTPEMQAFPRHPHSFLFGGGSMAFGQRCGWERTPPADGLVLARTCRLVDAAFVESEEVSVVRWNVGLGAVVACGYLPEPWRSEPAIASNASRFILNLVESACLGLDERRVAVCLHAPPPRSLPHPARGGRDRFVLPRMVRRAHPGALLVPHWGWRVAVNAQRDRRVAVAPRDVYDRTLVPSFRAGATLIDLQVAEVREGYPFAWSLDDPIHKPVSYRSHKHWPGWGVDQVALLAREAHHRGMWLQCPLDPAPVLGSEVGDRDYLDATRWLARELADVQRLGAEGAVDGFGVARWMDDRVGFAANTLRTYAPGGYGYHTAPRRDPVSGFVGAVTAERGAINGFPATGVSAQWRDVFPAGDFSVAALDARHARPSTTDWESAAALGGGSYPDWILTQLHDFARPRTGQGAAFWWVAHNDATLGVETERFVHGLSLDPLRAAVATRLTATGADGYRDLGAKQRGRVQRGFGAETPLPAATPFLQNNHFRLHGTGGSLWFDPTGTADLRLSSGEHAPPSATIAVAPTAFMRTRVRGFRPTVDASTTAVVDLIGSAPRGVGEYGESVLIEGSERGAVRFPAVLAREATPDWPQRVEAEFRLVRGDYRLEVGLLARSGDGMVEVRCDGEVLGLLPYRAGEGTVIHDVRVPLALDGLHRLALDIVLGDSVGVTACRLSRVDEQAGQSRVIEPAGFCAELREDTTSAYFGEAIRIRTIADLPGFVLDAECASAVRNVQVVRKFELPLHRTLRRASESSTKLVSPFVLGSSDSRVPDLAVIPLEVPFAFRFTLESASRGPGGGLELVTFPRPHQKFRVAFVFLRDHTAADLDALAAACRSVFDPVVARLEDGQEFEIATQARVTVPLLVKVFDPKRAPFFVRENGSWLFRGAQPTADADGGRWLRVYASADQPAALAAWDPQRRSVWPGPGSLHSIALRDVDRQEFEVEVLQVGPLLAAPSVVLQRPFDRVTVNGEPWSFVDGQRILLPAEVGTYRIGTRELGRTAEPRLLQTRALVRRCTYDDESGVLELFTVPRPEDGPDTVYTAWVGPARTVLGGHAPGAGAVDPNRPVEVAGEDARIVAEASFMRPPRPDTKLRGAIVRFRPGLLRVKYR